MGTSPLERSAMMCCSTQFRCWLPNVRRVLPNVRRGSRDPAETPDHRSPFPRAIAASIALLLVLTTNSQADEPPRPIKPTTIVVIGAGGAPQFDADFAEWADRWSTAATRAGH